VAQSVIVNIGQLVTPEGRQARAGLAMRQLTVVHDVYVKIENDTITEIGPMSHPPTAHETFDAQGGVVIPGLVDPHTHAVFYGTREDEFLARCQGEKYGKGILTTVERVQSASEDQIYEFSKRFLSEMIRLGTTAVEIKSGYGLNTESELKLLRVIKRLQETMPIEVVPTFCGAHAVPAGVEKSQYIQEIIAEMLPACRLRSLPSLAMSSASGGSLSLTRAERFFKRVGGLSWD
jgi:imidazolonepropionase